MNTISEENFIKPSFLKMEEYDQQIFGIQSKPYETNYFAQQRH